MLKSVRFSGWESLLHAIYWTVVSYVGEWIVAMLRPVSNSLWYVCRVGSLSYTAHAAIYHVVRWVGSFSYTPRAGICLVVRRVGGLLHAPCCNLSRLSSGEEFLLRLAGICLVVRRVGSLL